MQPAALDPLRPPPLLSPPLNTAVTPCRAALASPFRAAQYLLALPGLMGELSALSSTRARLAPLLRLVTSTLAAGLSRKPHWASTLTAVVRVRLLCGAAASCAVAESLARLLLKMGSERDGRAREPAQEVLRCAGQACGGDRKSVV